MKPTNTSAFATAYQAASTGVIAQVSRYDVFKKRMTAAAISLVTGAAIITGAPTDARAETSGLAHFAATAFGGIVGAAIGGQVGKGNGKTAATVAGGAAGVWVAEKLQEDANQAPNAQRQNTNTGFGPAIAPGWNDSDVRRINQTSRTSLPPQLQSGKVALTEDRITKLTAKERTFLNARDNLARSLYEAQQIQDDLVLEPNSKALQQQGSVANGNQRAAVGAYEQAREGFLTAVEHLGNRGYDVHQYAHSYTLANTRVTAKDLVRSDLAQVTSQVDAAPKNHDNYQGPGYGY